MSHSPQSALLQGLLIGAVAQIGDVLKVTDVQQDVNAEGNYTSSFVVQLFSGKRIRVTVEDEN